MLSKMLKVNKVANGRIDGLCDPAEDIEPYIGSSSLDFPQIGPARARHERKLALGYTAGLPLAPDALSQALFLGYVVHATSVGVGYSNMARYREPDSLFSSILSRES